MSSSKKLLLEHLYDGDLAADIKASFDAGQGWRAIAAQVSEKSGVTVSYESLRNWYPMTRGERVA